MRSDGQACEESEAVLIAKHCLRQGKLLPLLGAGVGMSAGIAAGVALAEGVAKILGRAVTGDRPTEELVWLGQIFDHERDFIQTVSQVMYRNFEAASALGSPLVQAVASLSMACARGGQRNAISFALDDSVECYLDMHGMSVGSTDDEWDWAHALDFSIYHPHGFLASREGVGSSESLVIDPRAGDIDSRDFLVSQLRTHFCVFVGLTLRNAFLETLLVYAGNKHASRGRVWGIFPTMSLKSGDPEWHRLKDMGIWPICCGDTTHMAQFLYSLVKRPEEGPSTADGGASRSGNREEATMAAEGARLRSVFISYGGPDEPFAKRLNDALRRHGVTTFLFSQDALPGKKLHHLMRDGVNSHDRVILVCTGASLVRPGVVNEIEEALQRESREGGESLLIPITLDEFVFNEWMPDRPGLAQAIRDRVVADFRRADVDLDVFDAGVELLVRALQTD